MGLDLIQDQNETFYLCHSLLGHSYSIKFRHNKSEVIYLRLNEANIKMRFGIENGYSWNDFLYMKGQKLLFTYTLVSKEFIENLITAFEVLYAIYLQNRYD